MHSQSKPFQISNLVAALILVAQYFPLSPLHDHLSGNCKLPSYDILGLLLPGHRRILFQVNMIILKMTFEYIWKTGCSDSSACNVLVLDQRIQRYHRCVFGKTILFHTQQLLCKADFPLWYHEIYFQPSFSLVQCLGAQSVTVGKYFYNFYFQARLYQF